MKRKLSLILAVLFVLALFAGCGGKTDNAKSDGTADKAGTSDSSGNNTAGSSAAKESEPEEDDSPYNFAVGKYKVNEEGWPVEKYEYELPLSTTGEKFTQWTVCWTPQYLPEDGYDGLSMYKGMQEMTGVDIEYSLVAADTRSENFSVLVNSDSLHDKMSQAAYFWTSGPLINAVEDGYLPTSTSTGTTFQTIFMKSIPAA
jgi:hypothetical protein